MKHNVRVCAVTSVVPDSAVLRIVAHQAPLSVGLNRQEYWSVLPCLLQGFLHPGIKRTSPASPALAGSFFTAEPLGEPIKRVGWHLIDFHQGSLSFLHIDSAAWNWLLFSHIGFSLLASAGFPTDHEQNDPVVFKIRFLWQKSQREVMLIM